MFQPTKAGPVTWEALKEDLQQIPKETLIDMVSMWIQNYWACQSYWVTFVERDYGLKAATDMDGEVFEKTARIQARKLKQLLGLGDDMQALAFVLKHTTPQWVPAGFTWEFIKITDDYITMRVRECPMGTFRKGQGLELFPCKNISQPLYTALAKAVNPKMRAICTHAHPDAPKEGVNCEWRFEYEA
jgi:hypothetical protein